jgi:putative transposase
LELVSQVCVKLYPSGRIHVIFIVEEPEAKEQSSEEPKKAVSVDLGIARLATLSDGRFLENPRPLERSLERIRTIQRTLSRRRFLSGNWLKTEMKLAKQYERVKDFRRDLFFKLGFLLTQEYDVLVLEDLNVESLIQKGVTKKRRLRPYDSSFSEIRKILGWEFLKRGKQVLPVPAYNTSRECFLCGRINKDLTLEDRVLHCPHCGFTLDRVLNACLVLLRRAGWVPPFWCAWCGAPPNTFSPNRGVGEGEEVRESDSVPKQLTGRNLNIVVLNHHIIESSHNCRGTTKFREEYVLEKFGSCATGSRCVCQLKPSIWAHGLRR